MRVDIKPTSRTAHMRDLKMMRRYGHEQHWRRMDAMVGEAEEDFYSGTSWQPGHLQWQRRLQIQYPARLVSKRSVIDCN